MHPEDLHPLRAHPRLPTSEPFTTDDAAACGVSAAVVYRMAREGLLRRVFRGVYIDAAAEDSVLTRARALALVVPPSAVVTDRTAGWLFGADVLAPGEHVIPGPLAVFQPPGRTRVRLDGTRGGERTLLPEDVALVHGIRVTTPLRTALDLGRLTPRDHAIGCLDSLLRLGGFGRGDLLGQVERFRRQRGVVQLRELAPLADARAESPAESVLRLRWLESDLPAPTPQLVVLNRGFERYRLDLGVEELRFAAEYDGGDWHSSERAQLRDSVRRRWLRVHGWTVVVLRKDDVFTPDRSRVGRILRAQLEPLLARHPLPTRHFGHDTPRKAPRK
jgi:hypothetical protein